VPIGHLSRLVASVVLDIEDKVDSDFLVSNRWWCSLSKVLESIVLIDLFEFFVNCFLPSMIAIPLVR